MLEGAGVVDLVVTNAHLDELAWAYFRYYLVKFSALVKARLLLTLKLSYG